MCRHSILLEDIIALTSSLLNPGLHLCLQDAQEDLLVDSPSVVVCVWGGGG